MERTIAIIPARGGSKRIPGKNIKHFLDTPIIAYSITAALESKIFSEIMVSTDDEEIAQISKKYKAKIPFYRSKALSSDEAMTAAVLLEVLDEYIKLGKEFDYVCCLYPCAPFVTSKHLTDGMDMLISSSIDAVVPVVKFSYPPQRCLVMRDENIVMLHPEYYNVRSQDLETYYHDTGQFYCIKSCALRKEKRLFCEHTMPLVLQESEIQDIDTIEDWKIAEIKYQILMKTGERSKM
jgi:N-acylneuraminate cytidylyltransferase